MKKEIKALIAVILAVWCFFMGFELGTFNERRSAGTNVAATTASQQTTAAPVVTTTEALTTA
ncbi:MAG: hypothetical protein IJ262_10855, partial [Clostridia bacterium]|nr:hypothetical protein [Clostridia bacterium]